MARYMTNDGLRRQLDSDAVVKLDGRISLARDWVERRHKKDKEIAVVFSAERLSGKWNHIANTGAKSKWLDTWHCWNASRTARSS